MRPGPPQAPVGIVRRFCDDPNLDSQRFTLYYFHFSYFKIGTNLANGQFHIACNADLLCTTLMLLSLLSYSLDFGTGGY